ncbi:SpoIIE family protein phosphatase [Microcoleus sp. D3_18a_C4]|uniref:SpoIIE family protein phosphatase n=1 Tax=unclassified Microcoleus TaxID=2642155 RepID=UPI002FCF2907
MSLTSLKRSVSKLSDKVPLRIVLVVPFVLQIFGTVGLVGWLSFRNGQQAVNEVASHLQSEISSRIQEHLDRYMATPHLLNELNSKAIYLGNLNLQKPSSRERYFWNIIQSFDSATHTYIGTTKGELFGSKRVADGSIQIGLADASTNNSLNYYSANSQGDRIGEFKTSTPSFDARVRPWYKAAIGAGKPVWSKIYTDFVSKSLLITGVQPISDKSGKMVGVLAVNITLTEVNKFLNSLKIGKSGQTFIIEPTGELVSTSTLDPVLLVKGKETERVNAASSQNPLIKATENQLKKHFGNLTEINSVHQLDFKLDGKRQFIQVQPFQDIRGLDWLIVVVIPEADFMEQINTNTHTTILLCIAALIVATGVGILTAKSVIQPLLRLNRAAKEIAQGKLEQTVQIERSDELGELATSFNSMAQQLQESFAALESKNADLQRLDNLKNEFLANTSHELRTPLNGMIGIAESMIDGATGETTEIQRKNLLMIALSGHRLSNLVNDILDFSKLRHKNIELQLKPVGMREIAEIVIMFSNSLIGGKNLQLINKISSDLPPAEADENRLEQIMHNLVSNAIKFTSEGQVEISAELVTEHNLISESDNVMHSYLAVTISDTGIGISEDKFDRIFESFEQGDGSTAREYGGTGLGLAVTKKLVELHGGEIKVESTIGVGSKFTFTIPVSEGEVEQRRDVFPVASFQLAADGLFDKELQSSTVNGQEKASQIKILIVDDEPVNLQVLVNYLSLRNYTITQANNGLEALEMIENNFIPDLILLDVMMPKMTGYEVTKKIRERYTLTEIPIVLLTAKNQVRDLVEGLSVGANDYLSKPVAKDELLARIQTHINLSRLRAENIRISAELDITRRLQQMNLPKESELQAIEGLEIAGFMEPAEQVCGDYYDVLNCNGKVKIGIGDVTGHGLESGVLMMMVQTAVRTLMTNNETDTVKFLDTINRTIYDSLERMKCNKNMTLCLLDYSERTLTLSGQHEEMIVVRNNGEVELIDTMDLGFPIGLDADIADFVSSTSVELNLDDVVVLYTDGITEAFDINKVEYGLKRLVEIVKQNRQHSTIEIKETVIADVKRHIGEQKVYDDITLVVLKQKS